MVEDASAGTVVLFPQSFKGIGYSVQCGVDKTFELAGFPQAITMSSRWTGSMLERRRMPFVCVG
jgi:hypothetical protein